MVQTKLPWYLLILLILIAALFLVGCDDDDDNLCLCRCPGDPVEHSDWPRCPESCCDPVVPPDCVLNDYSNPCVEDPICCDIKVLVCDGQPKLIGNGSMVDHLEHACVIRIEECCSDLIYLTYDCICIPDDDEGYD